MVCEKPVEQPKGMDNGFAHSKATEPAMVAPENGISSVSTSSAQCAAPSIKAENGQASIAEKDNLNQPASYHSYYYPGYNGSFSPSNNGTEHSSMGVQADNNSVTYYMPGYNPYAAGTFVGADGQAYYTSSGYLQTPVTYGTEALPCYAWDMSYLGDPSNGSHANATPAAPKSSPSPAAPVRSNGIKPSKLYGPAICKSSSVSSNTKSRQYVQTSLPNFDTQPLKPVNKSGSFYQPTGYANFYCPAGNFQSSSFDRRDPYVNNSAMGYRSNARMWNSDRSRPNRKGEFEMSTELTRGPRVQSKSGPNSSEKEPLGLGVQKDKYNLAEFQTEYEGAKFFVIKSYSEDDVHKCLKYDVWSSTANGNKKLDAAFHDTEVKASETGTKCPIFLFFSVNGSGQFVGVAEMTGKVDFDNSMDFWQLDKWSGFFPVKWHIVKDIPNSQLRHILLENNENRPVTYTRDTQEIGLKQGLEMLKIFKNSLAKTSLLDDFNFYEDREKALQNRRNIKSGAHQADVYGNGDLPQQLEAEAKGGKELSKSQVPSVSSLVNRTKNLSLNSDPKVVS